MRSSIFWLAANALALPSLVTSSPAQVVSPAQFAKQPVLVSRHGLGSYDQRREQLHEAWAELVRRANYPSVLEKRVSKDLDLSGSLDNEVLFDGNSLSFVNAPPVTVICAKCCTTGVLTADFSLEDLINPTFRVDLRGFSTFVNLDVLVSGSRTFEVTLIKSPPGFLNAAIPGVGSIGLILSLNLVVDLSATLDINGGFFVELPEDAFIETSIFGGGDISGSSFRGIKSGALPLTVNGNGTTSAIKLALQLRAEIGVKGETDLIPIPGLPDVGAGAELGVFVNLIELNGQVGEDPTLFNGTCLLAAQENFGLSVGAFLNLDVEVGAKTFGAVPTVSTTLFAGPSATQCLVSRGQVLPTRGPINTAPSVVCTDSLPFASATAAPVPVPVQTPRGGIGVSIVVPLPPAQRPTAAPYNPYPYSPYAGRRLAKRSPVSLRPLLAEASNATVALATGNGQAPVPTMLSTTTVTLTVCNYPGAIICPATAQSVVTAVATQTVTLAVCPPTPPALSPSSSVDSCAAAIRAAQSTTPAAALTSLASPIVATLAPRPTSPTNTTVPSFSGNNTSDLTITTTATIVVQPSPVPIDFANSVVGSVVVVPVGAGGGAAQGTAAALVPTAAARDAQPFTGAAAGRADVGTVGRVVAVAVGGIIASAVLTGGW